MAAIPSAVASTFMLGGMRKISRLTKDDSIELKNAVQKGLKQTGLYEKGVRVYTMEESDSKTMIKNFASAFRNIKDEGIIESFNKLFTEKDNDAINALKKEMNAVKQKKGMETKIDDSVSGMINMITDTINDCSAKAQSIPFKTGLNACYLPNANKIITPDKSLQTSVFHEMGHALNANGGKILKTLQKMRPLAKMGVSLILTVSLLNKRKTTDEKSDSKIQNVFDGIKKHAGGLSALAMMPMVAEEGIASLRGGNIAKNLFKQGKLSKSILNKVRMTNLAGFSTYVLAVIGTAAAAKFSIKVKDNIQAKYEEKQMQKFEQKLAKKEAKAAKRQ